MAKQRRSSKMHEPEQESETAVQQRPETNRWVEDYYREELEGKSRSTIDSYLRILYCFAAWVEEKPDGYQQFHPSLLTRALFKGYIDELRAGDYSTSYLNVVKTTVRGFALWLIDQGKLKADPTRGVTIPTLPQIVRSELTNDQRSILKRNVKRVEQAGDLRGAAIFALAYWAGCSVSDISYLLMKHTEVGPQLGKLNVGYREGKYRDIVLIDAARAPLYAYLQRGKRASESAYVFTSQRKTLPVTDGDFDGWRLTNDGIHHWFQSLKAIASVEESLYIQDITFYDLRHDFAHRARQEGDLSDSELAAYLGVITKDGLPTIKTIARYTQPDMGKIVEKLGAMKG
jgi:site-specific recombinase XerD